MSGGMLMQYIVIALIVFASALYALRKLAPLLTNRCLAAASIWLGQSQRATWLRAVGRHLQPKQATGSCSDGCSTCGACGSKPPAAAHPDVMPLEFRPRRHQ